MAQRLMLKSSDDLLTRHEAASFLGIKANTLAVWATTHRYALPYVKIGSLVRYKRGVIEKFVERRTVTPVDD